MKLLEADQVKEKNQFEQILYRTRKVFLVVFIFSFASNMLMLITPLYSLQVLDRVVGSGNKQTLLMLSIIIGMIYLLYGMLQIARSYTLIKIGEWLDNNVSPMLFARSVASAAVKQTLGTGQVLRDFQTVKTFLTSTGINTLFDAPWTLAYLIAIFMINSSIGYLTICGAIIIISFALLNAVATNKVLGEATKHSIQGYNQAEIATRNAEVVEAMGMMKNIAKYWHKFNTAALERQSVASYRNGAISNISRYFRNIIQMLVTAIGAYTVVDSGGRDMTTGGMIACSILVGKALAPFDHFIETWKITRSAHEAYFRVSAAFTNVLLRDDAMAIPHVEGHVSIENVYYAHQDASTKQNAMMGFLSQPKYTIQGVSFSIVPGEVVALIGPSAAGKSTFARLLTGIWKPVSGSIRLDGGEIYNWNRDNFGEHVGYLPQTIELFSASVKENIARMSQDIIPEKVITAAKIAGAHEMILKLPNGYDSVVGPYGSGLSGGQKQRVALARAFYGNPKLVVLDEPNANLDSDGEEALSNALIYAKQNKISVVVISHRTSILSVADKIAVMQNGMLTAYGPSDEIQRRIKLIDGDTLHMREEEV